MSKIPACWPLWHTLHGFKTICQPFISSLGSFCSEMPAACSFGPEVIPGLSELRAGPLFQIWQWQRTQNLRLVWMPIFSQGSNYRNTLRSWISLLCNATYLSVRVISLSMQSFKDREFLRSPSHLTFVILFVACILCFPLVWSASAASSVLFQPPNCSATASFGAHMSLSLKQWHDLAFSLGEFLRGNTIFFSSPSNGMFFTPVHYSLNIIVIASESWWQDVAVFLFGPPAHK